MVDLDRTVAADALYCDAQPVLEDLVSSPQVEALGQDEAESVERVDEDVPCEDLGFEELPAFLELVELWSRALSDIDDAVFPLLEESLYAAADAAGAPRASPRPSPRPARRPCAPRSATRCVADQRRGEA